MKVSQRLSKILFVSHTGARTGAPIVLERLLKWLRENSDVEFEILLQTGGALEPAFSALAPTLLFQLPKYQQSIWRRILYELGPLGEYLRAEQGKRKLLTHYKNAGIRLIYSNTITNGQILSDLATLHCPVICHIHELNYWINRSGPRNWDLVKNHTSHYIAASEAVKHNLLGHYGIPPERIDVIHEFVDDEVLEWSSQEPLQIRQQLNIPESALVVGGSGAEMWRKGKDLFIQLALRVSRLSIDTPVHFIWVGKIGDAEETYQLQHDIEHVGLSDCIHFTGEVANPMDFYAALDIFALVSREDPFPLVCLEAASLGKPILCFEGTGGISEFVEADAGFIVPYLDIAAMAEKVALLAGDVVLRAKMGIRAAERVRQRHHVSVAAPRIMQVIQNCIEQG